MVGDFIPPNVPLYLTPDSIPVGRFCRTISIPDDPTWVGLVDGVLSLLSNPKVWRQHGLLTPEETATAWIEMMARSWEVVGCPVLDVRQNPLNPCLLEKTFDGVTWEPFADLSLCKPDLRYGPGGRLQLWGDFPTYEVPDGDWVNDPVPTWFDGLAPSGIQITQTNNQCVAAANAANVLFRLFTGIQQSFLEVAGAIGAAGIEELMTGLGLVFGSAVLPYVATGFSAFFLGFSALFNATTFSDGDFRKLACLINDNMTGTDGNWILNFGAIRGGLAGAGINSDLVNCLIQELDAIGEDGLNIAAKTTAIVDYDCGAITQLMLNESIENTSSLTTGQNWQWFFTKPLAGQWGMARAQWLGGNAVGNGLGTDNTTATAAGWTDISKPVAPVFVGPAQTDIWWYNNTIYNNTTATAAIRDYLGIPTYNPVFAGTLGNINAGALPEVKWRASFTTNGSVHIKTSMFYRLTYPACP